VEVKPRSLIWMDLLSSVDESCEMSCFCTCSIDREEDRAVVEAFLSKHSEFSLVQDYLALPHREQADGAYAALLQRA
jgi:16S rRNA C967 or C1407 C5-methylase (RsmB/RsmF family)